MQLILLDSNFIQLHIIDVFDSILWIDRYNECGEFELVKGPDIETLTHLVNTTYVKLEESEHLMTIDSVSIETDIEKGNQLIVKGRSAEIILERRIVWDITTLNGSFRAGIKKLLDDAIILPTDSDRDISNFSYVETSDPDIIAMTVDDQFEGVTLYKAISDLCKTNSVGYKVTLSDLNVFEFQLYLGVDRSYNQITNPHVVFSPEYNNLISSNYFMSNELLKTVVHLAGEKGVGNVRSYVTVFSSNATGINRRELYKEASGVSRTIPGGGGQLTEEEYLALLEGRAYEELSKAVSVEAFDGEIDTEMYTFGIDFFMGDIVQIADQYGNLGWKRVSEIIYSQDAAGSKIYPTFELV